MLYHCVSAAEPHVGVLSVLEAQGYTLSEQLGGPPTSVTSELYARNPNYKALADASDVVMMTVPDSSVVVPPAAAPAAPSGPARRP